MNDTVIVFDRIREYSRNMKGADKTTIINRAINDTLSRTIMTSATVFITLLDLIYLWRRGYQGIFFCNADRCYYRNLFIYFCGSAYIG